MNIKRVFVLVSSSLLFFFLFSLPFSSGFFSDFFFDKDRLDFSISSLETVSETLSISSDSTPTPENEEDEDYTQYYRIRKEPICDEYDEDFNCIDEHPNLCPYISFTPIEEEPTEIADPLNASDDRLKSARGELNFLDDEIDNWEISVTSPCFEGQCPADYDESKNGTPLPQNLKGQTFECEVEVRDATPIFQTKGIWATPAYAATSSTMLVTAVLKGTDSPSSASSVLFIPGFMASDLYLQGTFSENKLWPPNSLTKADVEKLMLDQNGNPVTPGIYTKEIISEAFQVNIYKSFIESMDNMVEDGEIEEWKSFPYDWRKDISKVVNEDTTIKIGNNFENKKLINEAILLAQRSPTGKITIIGHSNGGIIGKALIQELADRGIANIVDQFVMVATPQMGTPNAIAGLLHGDGQTLLLGTLLDRATAIKLGQNMQSAYNLLPSQPYFNAISEPVIKFEDSISSVFSPSIDGLSHSISDYYEMLTFITSINRGTTLGKPTNVPNVLRTDLANNANSTINSLTSPQIPPHIQVFEIAGWGKETIKTISYKSKQENVCSNKGSLYVCEQKSYWDRNLLMTNDGDGTVVSPSATNSNTQNKYYLNLFDFNHENSNLNHSKILEAEPVLSLVSKIISKDIDEDALPNFVSIEKPTSSNQNLQLSVHSPISLGATDFHGRYTGPSNVPPTDAFTFIKEEIPNSYYLEIGEDKYIGLNNGGSYTVNLQGDGIGTFTFNQEVREGDTVINSKSFIDIPVTPLTQATLSVNDGNLSPSLNVDIDGNGSTDVQVQASNEFDPLAYLTIMRATIKSFNLKKNQENNLVNKINNLMFLIQKGKIDKVSTKAQKQINKLNQKLGKINSKPNRKNKKITEEEIQTIINNLEEFINNLK